MMDEEYYHLKTIASELGIVNYRSNMTSLPSHMKKLMKHPTSGGDQLFTFLSKEGLVLLLQRCRKPNVEAVAKKYNLNLTKSYTPRVEIDILEKLRKSFNATTILHQYKLVIAEDNYILDMYIINFKIAIEIDEEHHGEKKVMDIVRQKKIEKQLKCNFVRCSPYDKCFDIFELIGDIYELMYNKLTQNDISDLTADIKQVKIK